MYSYYVLRIEKFNYELESYDTTQQQVLPGNGLAKPRTTFKKKENQQIKDFVKYEFKCEMEKRGKIRVYGHEEFFEKFIQVEEEAFYINRDLSILIVSANKKTCQKLIKDLNEQKIFDLKKLEFDFHRIINDVNSLGIDSVWIGRIPDEINVNVLSLHGQRVENSTNYNALLRSGAEIQNLSVVYDFQDKQEKVMFTKESGVILYNKKDETDALLLVKDLYEKVLQPNSLE